MDNGIVADSSGAYFSGIATMFGNLPLRLGSVANPTNILVAAGSGGDFVTLQGAVTIRLRGNTTPDDDP